MTGPPTSQRLSVIIVTYNSGDHIDALLDSIPAAAGSVNVAVIVVDNDSSDDTIVRAVARGNAMVISAGANIGYSAAINLGREHAAPEAPIAILNPDVVLEPESLAALMQELDADSTLGIVTPRLMDVGGVLYHHLRREPALLPALGEAIFGSHWPARPRILSEQLRRTQDYDHPHDVDWAGGAALVISPRCNSTVGQWNARQFFLYAEETDYAWRARRAGFRVRFVPSATVMHHGGGSGSTPSLVALMTVNRLRYYAGRHGRCATLMYRLALALQHVLRVRHPQSRRALGAVLQRRSWTDLPSAEFGSARVLCSPSGRQG